MTETPQKITSEILSKRVFKTATEVTGPLLFVDLQGRGWVSY